MKRPLALFLAAVLVPAVICGCSALPTPSVPGDGDSAVDDGADDGAQPPGDYQPPEPPLPQEPAPGDGDGTTSDGGDSGETPDDAAPNGYAYLKFGSAWLPLSVVQDGQAALTGNDQYWYFDVEKMAQGLGIGDMTEAQEYFVGDMGPQNAICDAIAVKGWEPLVTPVTYQSYGADSQPEMPEWYDYFSDVLDSFMSDHHTPVIYAESWQFDLDGDGRDDYIVNACNFYNYSRAEADSWNGALPQQNPPGEALTLLYTCSALFWGDGTVTPLSNDIFSLDNTWPVSPAEGTVYYAYTIDESSDPYTECFTYALQYDLEGAVAVCPIYNRGEFSTLARYRAIIADTDADGISEIITWGDTIYAPITVYKSSDMGLSIVLRYWSPA